MQRRITSLGLSVFLFVLSLLQPLAIFACGMAMVPTVSGWSFGADSAEQSYISYKDGVENLIISRKFADVETGTVWVIPVPSKAENVSTTVIKSLPELTGDKVTTQALEGVDGAGRLLASSQLYPALPIWFMSNLLGVSSFNDNDNLRSVGIGSSLDGAMGTPAGITVVSHIEDEGMVVEVISALTSDALYEYLSQQGLRVEKDSIAILQDYIGEEFTFVATWVGPGGSTQAAKGVQITFATDSLFYPLKPESLTPGEGLPETISIMGHVTPKLFASIKNDAKVEYFRSEYGLNQPGFYQSDGSGYAFTKMVLDTKPSNLTQDLYFSMAAPPAIQLAEFVNFYPIVHTVIWLLLLSFTASVLAIRALSFTTKKPSIVGMGVFGCLTLVGTIVGTFMETKEKRLALIAFHSMFFMILLGVTWILQRSILSFN